jgi:hypothetical protein
VVKHGDGVWAPPTVSLPPTSFLGAQVQPINDAVKEFYGLDVRYLRHIAERPDQHVLELEMPVMRSSKRLQAVWMGREEYLSSRKQSPGRYDPFLKWLEESARSRIPASRPPWERRGWFSKAAAWIQSELDRLGIQVTGSVRQFRMRRDASAVLRVATAQGYCYFKACSHAQPNEASMTFAAAGKWPHLAPKPLAIEVQNVWILNRDLGPAQTAATPIEDYIEISRAMAELQVESLGDIDQWRNLGCIDRGPASLRQFLTGIDERLSPIFDSAEEGSDHEETLQRLPQAAAELAACCEQLEASGVPAMLVHPDYRPANLYRYEHGFWVTDWADAMVSHPFFTIARFAQSIEKQVMDAHGRELNDAERSTMDRVTAAYLQPFEAFASPAQLREALGLARRLWPVSELSRWTERLARLEPGSMYELRAQQSIRGICSRLVNPRQDETG